MMTMARATLIYGVLFAAIFTFIGVQRVPRTIGLIQPIVVFLLVGTSRAAARVWIGGLYQLEVKKSSLPQVLIYGAGNAGRQLASGMTNSHEMRVVGFLDDDERLHGHVLNGLQIYNPADLEEIANQIHQEILSNLKFREILKDENLEVVPLLASVCDEVRMHEIMDTWRPHTVYHAAAYKHVPLVEHNPAEGVRNNVWGTKVCAEAAARNGVKNFVLISTDKAVRPANIMGATKRLAEMLLQSLNEIKSKANSRTHNQCNSVTITNTCFSMVRFGNVLGSSGSVVPLFREQIKNGGPITLTHPEITRYFMTIPEAAQLVIQAGAMGSGGDVFVLNMGEPVRIYDLASRIVELSGLTLRNERNPKGDIEIKVTGLRPGEKLYEELLIGDNPEPTQHPRIMKAQEKFIPWEQLQGQLNSLNLALSVNDVPLIRRFLQELVSGYKPSGEVVDWVYLAQERQSMEL